MGTILRLAKVVFGLLVSVCYLLHLSFNGPAKSFYEENGAISVLYRLAVPLALTVLFFSAEKNPETVRHFVFRWLGAVGGLVALVLLPFQGLVIFLSTLLYRTALTGHDTKEKDRWHLTVGLSLEMTIVCAITVVVAPEPPAPLVVAFVASLGITVIHVGQHFFTWPETNRKLLS